MPHNHEVGAVSRRAFVQAATAVGLTSLVGAGPVRAAEQKRGGRLRMALAGGGTTDSLDPGTLQDACPSIISFQARDTLVELLPNLQPGPELAESWESSPDAQVWTFNLRKGVEFHNGKTFGADDVIFSINHHKDPKNGSSAAGFVRPIIDMKADGNSRVIFTLSGGNADFPLIMTEYRLPMMPAGTDDFNAAIGTGAYILKSFEPGVRAFSTRNPNYWRTDRGFFDEVETLNINDTTARTNALLSGRVDLINRVDLRTVNLLGRNSAIKIKNAPGFKEFVLPMLTDLAPYNDNNVRLALKWGIDRKQFVEKVLNGFGEIGNDLPLTPNHRYYNNEIEQRQYDPDRAKFHLKKAGLTDPTFELHASEAGFDGAVDAAVIFQDSAAKAGMKINIKREPLDGYFVNVWRKVPFCTSFSSARSTEDATFSLIQTNNETHWNDPRWNALLVSARGELDTNKRRDSYHEMQQIMWDSAGQIIPVWINNVSASTNRLFVPDQVSVANEMDGYRVAERWSFS